MIELEDNESPEYLRELRSFSSEKEFSWGERTREHHRYQGVSIAIGAIEKYCSESHFELGIPCECKAIVKQILDVWYG